MNASHRSTSEMKRASTHNFACEFPKMLHDAREAESLTPETFGWGLCDIAGESREASALLDYSQECRCTLPENSFHESSAFH
jgi:hypothetical protein